MTHVPTRWGVLIVAAVAVLSGCAQSRSGRLDGFEVSRHWGEQVKDFACEPGVRIRINAPSEAEFDRRRPTDLVLYALPNGNTIEWTIGRQRAEGLDWHYDIQHIGAQARCLREVMTDRNIVVVYLEADTKSWPRWRRDHEHSSQLIHQLVDRVRAEVGVPDPRMVLTGHSGGGSFTFGYLNGAERIPDDVTRIAFLDSNYSFSVEDGHDAKLIEWLRRGDGNCLAVLAYDDREITFNGKKVVGPTGGTFRATHRMLASLRPTIPLEEALLGDYVRYRGLAGRVDIIVHTNLENRILHTALVGDMNGFIHAMTTGSAHEDKAGRFGGPVVYGPWIQPD